MPPKQVHHPGGSRQKKQSNFAATKKVQSGGKPADRAKIITRLKRIRTCYEMGVNIRDACAYDIGASDIRKQARFHRVSENTARRYRQFATVYTPEELKTFLILCSTKNYAVSMTHIYVLICVADKKFRKAMEKDAAKKKLSIGGLWRLKKTRIKNPKAAGGRRPDVVKLHDAKDLLAAIHFETTKWRRWLDMLLSSDKKIRESLKSPLLELHSLVQKVEEISSR